MMCRPAIVLLLLAWFMNGGAALGEMPRSLDPRLNIELFAEHPQIVTPTGLDVDDQGRVWAIESNTHFPPSDYTGHPTDRILVFRDRDADGRADDVTVFTDGLTHSMSVAVRPRWLPSTAQPTLPIPQQSTYIATRRAIYLYHDDDGDNRADRWDELVHLETTGNYPHNGLAGFAFDALGWMYFGFGENLGADYRIVGSDGTTFEGGGEGGNIYRCRPDGTLLSKVATGFWNPHASCVDALGRLFTVDNDPDSRPPCRLLHVIPNGDYGYRFRNGRKGLHTFSSWNGEIPGTLPMVAGTGEAPSGIVAYESDGLPSDYQGNLIVTSWGDHRIDRFQLIPKGTSFTSLAEPVIAGDENFRPVGIACGPDGSLYCTDWVLRDYKLHGHGRIWRISSVAQSDTKEVLENWESKSQDELKAHLVDRRLPIRRLAAQTLIRRDLFQGNAVEWEPILAKPRARLELHWACVQQGIHSNIAAPWGSTRFITYSPREPASTWLQLSPLIQESTGHRPAKFSTEADFEQEYVKACETLLAAALQGKPTGLIDNVSLLAFLRHSHLRVDSPLLLLAASIDDPFLFSTIVSVAAAQFTPDDFAKHLNPEATPQIQSSPPKLRQAMLLAARKQDPKADLLLRVALLDRDPVVRRLAVQWAAEENLTELRSQVDSVFDRPEMTSELFLAALAAQEMLDGKSPADFDKSPAGQYVLPLLKDTNRPAAVRAQALRLVAPTDPALNETFFAELLATSDPQLQLETVRTLQGARPEISARLLQEIVSDPDRNELQRLEAVVGLTNTAKTEPTGGPARSLLKSQLNSSSPAMQREALRAVRPLLGSDVDLRVTVQQIAESLGRMPDTEVRTELADQIRLALRDSTLDVPPQIEGLASPIPSNREEWFAELNRGRNVDPEAGRRLFFHPNAAGCSKCHTINGRGGRVGPELSRTVETLNRIQLIQSILEPSREIAPQFVAWTLETQAGRVFNGMIVHENAGKTILGNATGELIELETADIIQRVPQKVSIMPEKLHERMTLQELRDLLAYLDQLR